MTARLEPVSGTSNAVKLVITAVPGSIAFEQAGDLWQGTLDITIAQRLANGTARRSVERTLDLSLDAERYGDARTRGFSIDAQVTLSPDVQHLSIVVYDVLGGSTGSIIVSAGELRALIGNRR